MLSLSSSLSQSDALLRKSVHGRVVATPLPLIEGLVQHFPLGREGNAILELLMEISVER